MNLVLDAIDHRHHQRREGQIRIRTWIRATEFNPLRLGTGAVHRNPTCRRTIALRVRQIHRRFIAGHQPLVTVGRRIGERQQGRRVCQNPANRVDGFVAQPRITATGKQRLATLPQGNVCVHSRAVVAIERFGHERDRLAMFGRHVFDDVLVQAHAVGDGHQIVKTQVDFRLAGGGDFVMLRLDIESTVDHRHHHLVAQIHQLIGGGDGKVAFLMPQLVAQIRAPALRTIVRAAVPLGFVAVNEKVTMLRCLIEANIIEHKELRLGSNVARVGHAGASEIIDRFAGDITGIAGVILASNRILDIADHAERCDLGEWIDERRFGLRHEQHVAFIDRLPTTNA